MRLSTHLVASLAALVTLQVPASANDYYCGSEYTHLMTLFNASEVIQPHQLCNKIPPNRIIKTTLFIEGTKEELEGTADLLSIGAQSIDQVAHESCQLYVQAVQKLAKECQCDSESLGKTGHGNEKDGWGTMRAGNIDIVVHDLTGLDKKCEEWSQWP